MGYSNGLLESDEKGGSGERGEQGLPGIGFKLTDDGNFDIDGKRLTDVSLPVDGGDATTKAYVDGEIGHHTGNFYHLRQSFTFYDSSDVELPLRTDSITGLVTDYKHGYYKIPKSGDDNYFSTLDIKIRNNLPQSTYSALFYLYGYRNNSIMSGVDLGPVLFSVDSTNYNILKYDDDDSTDTRNHTKGIIWFTSDGSAGSIELGFRFFDKSITHFVILSRCVEGKVNLGFSSNIFNVSSTVGDVTLYFEDINMNSRKIKNLGGPTGDGDAINKKYLEDVALTLDGSNVMTGDLRMGQKRIVGLANPTGDGQATNKKYVDGEIGKLPQIDTTLFLHRDGSLPMTGNFETGGNYIDGLPELVEVDQSDASIAKIKGRAIDFGYFHKQRGALKRLIELEASKLLPINGNDPMKGNLKMTDNEGNIHKIIKLGTPTDTNDAVNKLYVDSNLLNLLPRDGSRGMLKDFNINNNSMKNLKDPVDKKDAANKEYVDTKADKKFVDDKIKESEERSIRAVSQENAFLKVMDDDLFVIEDDDIHRVGVVDKKFHQVNQQTYQFKIDYDSKIGYYSTRLGVSVIYLPISHYTIIFEMYFSDKIDPDQITIDSRSGTLQVNKINTKISSDHTRSVINFYKDQILPSDDELDIDIALKNKTGQSYDSDTQIFVVVYGVYGTQNDVDIQVWDRYFYIDDKKIHFEAPIDMVDKDIENVNNLSINNELNMNNRQIKNLGDGIENSDGVNVKQLNDLKTNVTGEFGKVNPVLKNNSDLIKLIYRNLIRNDSKLLLIKELYFPDSVQGRTQNNYSYQTNGDNKGEVTFYLTFVHKATTSDSMIITIHWFGGIPSIYIFISKDRLVVSKNLLINESSLKSYNIPSYFKGKYLYLWIRIQNNVIKINFSGSKTISATHPNIQNKDENLSIICVRFSFYYSERFNN